MVHVKLSKLIAAACVASVSLLGFSGAADAASPRNAPASCATGSPVGAPDTTVASEVPCDPTSCVDGVLTVVTDDNGVQHQACVASAASAVASASASVAVVVVPERATLAPVQQSTSSTPSLPTTGTGTGGLVIAALLVGSGSIVSLLSRRRPVGGRKRFRRRNVTP
jgi:hypothetical protein